uniref:Uncharacterized protein n=1 Tax=Oryza barthii TaxID=65489 RepID=A0A0D3HJ67_9ORYZ
MTMIHLISSLLTCCLAPTLSKRREDHQNKLDHFLSLSLKPWKPLLSLKTPFLGSSLPPTMEDASRGEEENSMFETSHVLGALLASSPLLARAWDRCAAAADGGA